MSSQAGHDARFRQILLQAIALSRQEFSLNAGVLGTLTSKWLADEASKALHKTCENTSSQSYYQTRLAVLAVFHRLSELPKAIPIDFATLHDFIIVFTSSSEEHANSKDTRLARRIIDTLFRKKPSLVRAIETQLIPGWSEMLTAFAMTVDAGNWLVQAQAITSSITALSSIPQIRDVIRSSNTAHAFWTAFQSFYDVCIPQLCSSTLTTSPVTSASQIPDFTRFVHLRKELVDFYSLNFRYMSSNILSEAIENEASSPEPPKALSDLAIAALINLTLLQDAEYYHHISRLVGSRRSSGAATTYSHEERTYFQTALDFTKTIAREDIVDSLAVLSKGKGKANVDDANTAEDDANTAENSKARLASMVNDVLSVLPDTPVQEVRRLLNSAALEQVSNDLKVERVISMLLEGDLLPMNIPVEPEVDQPTAITAADTGNAQPSRFASIRSNIFTDTLDVARLHRGKQDLSNDTFLSAELRASILAAAQRQADESDEEEEERRRMEEEESLAEQDGDDDNPVNVKVKDDVSEESGIEDSDQPAPKASSAMGASTTEAKSKISSLSATGVPRELEKLYMTTYIKDTAVFTREQRKSTARGDLKKKIIGLRLPDSISDEQIEGWARMLERNPRKDKLLERFGDQQWHGNEKGNIVHPGTLATQGGGKGSKDNADPGTQGQSEGAGRGRGRGQGGRGRGGKGNRGHQSDTRRRGHDKKMQKAGI